jgi:hypothetical protein
MKRLLPREQMYAVDKELHMKLSKMAVYTRDALLPPLCPFILLKCPCSAEFMKHSLQHCPLFRSMMNKIICTVKTVTFRRNEKFVDSNADVPFREPLHYEAVLGILAD